MPSIELPTSLDAAGATMPLASREKVDANQVQAIPCIPFDKRVQ
jgi:hypothetical protein